MLSLDFRPPLAVLTLSSPESGNRVSRVVLDELRGAVERLADDSSVRVVVLTGSGSVFSLGWDPALLEEQGSWSESGGRGLFGATFQFLVDCPLPLIAAVNGDALSAGFELALACDLRIAAKNARFGFPETAEGRIPMGGGTQRLARIAGRAVALEMILSGEPIDAPSALARGLVSAVTEPETVLDWAAQLAGVIAQRGPIAVRLAKEAVHRGLDLPLDQALRYEGDLTILLQTTRDRAEGVQAFKEKRVPHYEGH